MSNELDNIRVSGLLESKDIDCLYSLKEELRDVFTYGQVFRTRTEMEASVLNDIKRPTPDAKFWQSVREQGVMLDELAALSYDYRKAVVELRQIGSRLEKLSGDELELAEIERDRMAWKIEQMQKVAHHRIRELREWSEIKEKLLPVMACGTTDPNAHQLVSYAIGWMREIQAGGLDTGSAPERINLAAKADAILKLCGERGVLDVVADQFPKEFIASVARLRIGGEHMLAIGSGNNE